MCVPCVCSMTHMRSAHLEQTDPASTTLQAITPLIHSIPSAARDAFAAFVVAVLENVRSQSQGQAGDAAATAYSEFTRLHAVYT